MKLLLFIFIAFIASCSTYKMLDGKVSNVTFHADSTLFNADLSNKPILSYSDLYGINFTSINLEKGIGTKVPISYPTFFYKYIPFLIYPGETINISLDEKEDFKLTIVNNPMRNIELLFINKFTWQEINREDSMAIWYAKAADVQKEKILISSLNNTQNEQLKRLEAMAIQENISTSFKKILKPHFEATPLNELIGLYTSKKDSLIEKGLYRQKMHTLLEVVNNLKDINQITYGHYDNLSRLANELIQTNIQRVYNTATFQNIFDTTVLYFKGISRDFIITKLIYTAYNNRVNVEDEYLKKYYAICSTPQYANIIKNLIKEKQQIEKKLRGSNSLLSTKGNKVTDIESLLSQNKGKVILIDFWASWCQPCISEIPAIKKLEAKFADKKFQIIYISFDKETQKWKKSVLANNLTHLANFKFVNAIESEFVIKNNIESIPRYMLFGKDGKPILTNAPQPSDPALAVLIEKNL